MDSVYKLFVAIWIADACSLEIVNFYVQLFNGETIKQTVTNKSTIIVNALNNLHLVY
jgi:hypothetical protein